jgi:hypothetical protein
MKQFESLRVFVGLGVLCAPLCAQSKIEQFNGTTNMQFVGYSTVCLGDIDGDGLPDWATGAPSPTTWTTIPGRVYVCRGYDATPIRTLNGSVDGDDFGTSLADVGDIDNDGVHELLVGAPDLLSTGGHDSAGGTPGYIEVFSGATGALLVHVDGDTDGDMFGAAVAGMGDLDGDAVNDFVVGAPGFGTLNRGLVRAISGATGATIWSVVGALPPAAIGSCLSAIGDVDADGFIDVLVGAPNWDGPHVDSGAAWVFSGANGATLRTWFGPHASAFLGVSVAGVGDLDGDAVPDAAVGAMNAPQGLYKGAVYAFSGQSGATLFSAIGPKDGTLFGCSVAAIGDVDGDGTTELAVGGYAYAFLSANSDGMLSVLSGGDGHEIGRVLGSSYGERLGWSLAGVGDVDGNGKLDFVTGASAANGAFGLARVYTTDTPMPPSKYCKPKMNSQGCVPTFASSGSLSLSGPDDFNVSAANVINKKWGLFIWSSTAQGVPFQNGTLCVGAPQKRSGSVFSGGSSTGADCSGVMNYHFDHATMLAKGLTAGSMFVMQAWYRDTALPINQVGLSDGLLGFVAP